MLKKRFALWSIPALFPLVLMSCPSNEPNSVIGLPAPVTPHPGVALSLQSIAQGLDRPLFVTAATGDAERLFIVEQGGEIKLRLNESVLPTPFLDLSEVIGSSSGERGLLGLAPHPDYANNGRFYVHYTNADGNSTIASCSRSQDPNRADPATLSTLLTVEQPLSNHKGGMVAFGPDGYLYIALGDGGGANDPNNFAQSLNTHLGKILRIDVDGAAPYAIPPDNPFVATTDAEPEIWAYGLRNPWRFSFDRLTGDLWIGDVGQDALEEIDVQPAASTGGENYGWHVREGSLCRTGEENCDLPGATDPLLSYFRVGRQSVTGGYVYRGSAIPALQGTYLFADYVAKSVFSLKRSSRDVTVLNETDNLTDSAVTLSGIASLGEDAAGELYLVDYGTGAVYKIVAG